MESKYFINAFGYESDRRVQSNLNKNVGWYRLFFLSDTLELTTGGFTVHELTGVGVSLIVETVGVFHLGSLLYCSISMPIAGICGHINLSG